MRRGGANTVVLPRHKRNKINESVSLPLFGNVELHLPDFFVIKMKKGYKLVSPVTKSGAITSRNGKKAFKLIKNEKNELFLHEPSFPQIYSKEFSKKDREIIDKYFHKIPSSHPSYRSRKRSSISSITNRSFNDETDTLSPSGRNIYSVRKSYQAQKADEKREKNEMANQDTRRIARMARIASKKQEKEKGKGRGTRKNRRI